MALSLAMDLLVSGLLAVTICYAMVLNKKIGTLRRDKSELEKVVAAFNAATAKADKSLKQLKKTAGDLGDRIDKARSLREDLVFLTERGTSAADKLERLVRDARDRMPAPAPTPAPERTSAPEKSNRFTDDDLVRRAPDVSSEVSMADFGVTDFPLRQAPGKNGAAPKRRPVAEERSDAERALIRALQLAR